jgi:hypothetical protein
MGSRRAATRSLACALATLLLLAVGTAGCRRPPDADGETTVELDPRQGLPFPETDAGRAVESHLDAMFSLGPDAEVSYQASLSALRARGTEAIATLVTTYNEAEPGLYPERAALVETLSELRMPEARDALMAIARQALPERAPAPDDTLQAIEPELVIRMTAIRGLGHLAVEDDTAVRALAELAKHPEMPIHEQAKQSLALVIEQEKDRERLQRLIELFPGHYQDWLPLLGVAPPAPSQ